MDSYTHIAMCRVSAYICVFVVPVKCEKYSLKGDNFRAKTRNLPIYYYNFLTPYLTPNPIEF